MLRSFSKVYGLAGLRVGYLLASEEVVDYAERARPPFNVNRLAQVAVALNVNINFLAAVQPGARLIAEGTEEHVGGRTGLYRLAVTTEDGTLVALAHGMAYRKRQPLIPGKD
jgi:uncharacterized protein (TIGR00369 family)